VNGETPLENSFNLVVVSVRVYQLFNPTSVEDKANKFVEVGVQLQFSVKRSKHKAILRLEKLFHKKFGREIGDFECRRQV